jgi:hypothetical protein
VTDKEARRVPDSELDYTPELIYSHRGELFTGIGYDHDPTTGISEVSYVDGRQEGVSRDWYPSGRLKSETDYRANDHHGFNRDYREDGTISLEEFYEFGLRVWSKTFDEHGRVVESYQILEGSEKYRRLDHYRRAAPTDSERRR